MSYFLYLCECSVPYCAFLEAWNWVVAGQHLSASHPIHQFDQIQMLLYFRAITFWKTLKCHIFSTVKAFDLILKLRARPEYQLYSDTKYKNPAYRRHRIYRPMRIVAPIFLFPLASKKGLKAFFLPTKKTPSSLSSSPPSPPPKGLFSKKPLFKIIKFWKGFKVLQIFVCCNTEICEIT